MEPTVPAPPAQVRGAPSKEGPFCWQAKAARRAIREKLSEETQLPLALCVYDALTEIASNKEAAVFTERLLEIAKLSGLSKRTVIRVLPLLSAAGLVSIRHNSHPESSLKSASTYSLLSVVTDSHLEVTAFKSEPAQSPLLEESTEEHREEPIEQQVASVYSAYPKKADKPNALKAIRKAIRAHGFDHVLERTEAFVKARQGADPRYTPHPATWFNGERFNDDPTTWAPSTQLRTPEAKQRQETIQPPRLT